MLSTPAQALEHVHTRSNFPWLAIQMPFAFNLMHLCKSIIGLHFCMIPSAILTAFPVMIMQKSQLPLIEAVFITNLHLYRQPVQISSEAVDTLALLPHFPFLLVFFSSPLDSYGPCVGVKFNRRPAADDIEPAQALQLPAATTRIR